MRQSGHLIQESQLGSVVAVAERDETSKSQLKPKNANKRDRVMSQAGKESLNGGGE